MVCNGLQREDSSGIIIPWLKLPCKSGLHWEDFWGITPWLKLPCKNVLQWAELGRLFRNYPPPRLNLPCKSGLQCAAMGGILRNYPPLSVRNYPPWCMSEGAICSEGGKMCWELSCKGGGVKWCKSEGIICSEGVKRCKSWAAKRSIML